MLRKIVEMVSSSHHHIKDGTLFCNNYKIVEDNCIEFLQSKNAFENDINSTHIGETIDLELSLAHLNALGFYQSCEVFVLKNKYSIPNLSYIHELGCFSNDTNDFFSKHIAIINLINAIKGIAKHSYLDVDIDNSIIFREDKTIFLPFIYNVSDINIIGSKEKNSLDSLSKVFEESDTEKKVLFINELIEHLISKQEGERFKFLLSSNLTFYEKCNHAYQFYLRGFSYNKLKFELDSKALEYSQNIQSVINDSQTKLIAIPTAFVLVFAAFNYTDVLSIKNVISAISLIIFALLIQIFLNNQKSTLNFIKENILSYRETFKENDIEKISSKFKLVEKELKKQENRLFLVESILWSIPILLFCLIFFLTGYKFISFTGVAVLICIIIYKILI